MKIPSKFSFLFALHCICLLSSANCKEQLIRDENSEHLNPNPQNSLVHGRVITSRKEPVANNGAFDKLPTSRWKNFGQSSEEITWKNQRVRSFLKNKNATSSDKLRSTIFRQPDIGRLEENGQLFPRKLNRRSVQSAQTEKEKRSTRESGFPRQAFDPNGKLNPDPPAFSFFVLFSSWDGGKDQHYVKRQADAETFREKEERRAKNHEARVDSQRAFNLSDLLPFKNGSLEMVGLPGQPIRKILDLFFNAIKQKPKDGGENENQQLHIIGR
ncbi:uncharacterized protein LOC122566940 isoform X2 [Bombus pyrosoma]|uniref:uncharacterized protein LOC122566940 isoform X2 n=1 Tax=Bombus pyrosoma TaxID=396416 RepID=UPI001CB94091|nr:uncharacterized protein LOC122566940 isoform X2 [Bombus pyrosoma]